MSQSRSANTFMQSITPKTVMPNTVPVPPMQGLTGSRPTLSLTKPQSAISALSFTQLQGSAVSVAASPDGTFWVLSTQGLPNGDKFIYHWTGSTFVNVPGAASRIAVGPDGTPWVINAAGGIYHLVGGVFTGIAGAAAELSVGGTASATLVDVISNQAPGPYGAGIYQYNVNAGTWTQLPGAGVTVAASIDSGTYSALNITPGGFYVTNQVGGIYYYNVGQGFEQLPGGAIRLAPTATGGIFALGDPTNPVQHGIYYNDLSTGQWTQMPGAAVSISANSQEVYVVGAAGGIYQSPVVPLASSNVCASTGTPSSVTLPFSPGTVTFTTPTVGGCTFSSVLSGVTTSGSVSGTVQLTAPAGLPSPPAIAGSLPFTSVFYASLTTSNALAFNSNTIPSFSVTIPSVSSGVTFYIAQWQTAPGGSPQFVGYVSTCSSSAPLAMTVSGNTLSLPAQTCPGGTANATIAAGTTLTEAVVYVPSGTALPSGAACISGPGPVSTTVPFAPGTSSVSGPVVGGCSLTSLFSGTTTSGSITVTTQLTAPAGLAAPTSAPPGFALPYTAVFYTTTAFNNTYAQNNNGIATFTVSVPSIAPLPGIFYLATWLTLPGGSSQFEGYVTNCNNVPQAFTVSGNTLTLPGATTCGSGPINSPFVAGSSATAALVYF